LLPEKESITPETLPGYQLKAITPEILSGHQLKAITPETPSLQCDPLQAGFSI